MGTNLEISEISLNLYVGLGTCHNLSDDETISLQFRISSHDILLHVRGQVIRGRGRLVVTKDLVFLESLQSAVNFHKNRNRRHLDNFLLPTVRDICAYCVY